MSALLFIAALCVVSALAAEVTVTSDFKPEGCAEAKLSKAGDQLGMHYTGSIDESSPTGEKGKKFDSSLDGGDPFEFALGSGEVIKGWDEGLLGMCIGEKRTLIIPAEKGYGESGAGDDIPGGATLKFTVECLSIGEEPQPMDTSNNTFEDIDVKHGNNDGVLTMDEIDAWFKAEEGEPFPQILWDRADKNKDGHISWDEFSGPKGDAPPREEL